MTVNDDDIAAAILRLAGEARSIAPGEIAQALMPGPTSHHLIPAVRRVAVKLAQAGALVILRKGKPVPDPAAFKGVYRLALPVKVRETARSNDP